MMESTPITQVSALVRLPPISPLAAQPGTSPRPAGCGRNASSSPCPKRKPKHCLVRVHPLPSGFSKMESGTEAFSKQTLVFQTPPGMKQRVTSIHNIYIQHNGTKHLPKLLRCLLGRFSKGNQQVIVASSRGQVQRGSPRQYKSPCPPSRRHSTCGNSNCWNPRPQPFKSPSWYRP